MEIPLNTPAKQPDMSDARGDTQLEVDNDSTMSAIEPASDSANVTMTSNTHHNDDENGAVAQTVAMAMDEISKSVAVIDTVDDPGLDCRAM